MNRRKHQAVSALALLAAAGAASAQDLEYLGPLGGHHYFATDPVTIAAARNAAARMASDLQVLFNQDVYLTSIAGDLENDFLRWHGADEWWIGLSDEISEGTFVWDNGEPLLYTNWSAGEPNNFLDREDHVAMNDPLGLGGRGWNDREDFAELRAIIEVERPVVCREFRDQRTLGVGDAPNATALADLNHDGILDAATVNLFSGDVSVSLGNGDGTFQAASGYFSGTGPHDLVIGHFNNDSHLDIATVNENDDTVSVLQGDGNGSFLPPLTTNVGDIPRALAAGDLNADGVTDLIVTNINDDTMSVLIGNGNGTFQPQQTLAAGDGTRDVAIADVNADGNLDALVISQNDDTLWVRLGNGDGTLQNATVNAVGDNPKSIVIAHLNADAHLDVAIANGDSDDISVLRGNGNGTFQFHVRFAAGDLPFSLGVADATGDGVLDLITANRFSDDISVLAGNGDATFQPQQRYAAGTKPVSVAVGDLTASGANDLLVANFADDTLSAILRDCARLHVVGPGAFATVQDAVDAANAGDSILILPGTYTENVTIDKSLSISGLRGASETTVNGAAAGPVFDVVGGDLLTIDRITIANGDNFDCGGLRCSAHPAQFIVSNCIIRDNVAGGQGGGACSFANRGTFINTLFVANNSPAGSGFYGFETEVEFINCTFVGNSGAPAIENLGNGTISRVRSTVVWDNPGGSVNLVGPDVAYSNIENGFQGPGNINADPVFTNPAAGDYTLAIGSPNIDAGDSTSLPDDVDRDLAGGPRVIDAENYADTGLANGDGVVDIGVFEAPADLDCACPADMNCDGSIDSNDFFGFLDLFVARDDEADFNGDGQWDANDFFGFLDLFVQGC